MAVTVGGRVIDQTGKNARGLWVEVWHGDRLVGRADAPSDREGMVRVEATDRELEAAARAGPVALELRVQRDDGTSVTVVNSGVVTWSPDAGDVDVSLEIDEASPERPEIRLAELNDRLGGALPEALVDRLRRGRIATLADVRARGGVSALDDLTAAQRRGARLLEAHARLDVLATDTPIANRLIDAGIAGVTDLARADEPTLAEQTGIDLATLRDLKGQAITYRATARLAYSSAATAAAPVNRIYRINRLRPGVAGFIDLLPGQPDPDLCEVCAACHSALSPAAYLVDLIDFLIDHFKTVTNTHPTIVPKGFPDLGAIEARFYRPLGDLVVECEGGTQEVRQIDVAIEVLERFLSTLPIPTGTSREAVYAIFDRQGTQEGGFGYLYPYPDVLSRMFDAYLDELSVTRTDFEAAITDAYPAAGGQPDLTKLNTLLGRLGVTEAALRNGLGLAAGVAWTPRIKAPDWMPELLRRFKAKGLDQNDPRQVGAYRNAVVQAESAVARVKERYLPQVRENLIAIALRLIRLRSSTLPHLAGISTGRSLGDYLHVDLEMASCAKTTRLANAIEALQSWVIAFLSGREDPGYWLMFAGATAETDFDARWRWMKSFGTWQAAQAVLLFRENFLLANLRSDRSTEFDRLLEDLDAAGTDLAQVELAVTKYQTAAKGLSISFGKQFVDHPTRASGMGLKSFHNLQKAEYQGVGVSDLIRRYLDEWYFFLPLAVADHLHQEGDFDQAAIWLNSVYFPLAPDTEAASLFRPVRLVWWGFSELRNAGYAYRNTLTWLTDPFNPFAIARVQEGAFVRHAIIRHVENLLDWADTEFARDTSESIASAREHYEQAEKVLGADEIPQEDACRIAWNSLFGRMAETHTPEEIELVLLLLSPILAMNGRVKRSDIAAFEAAVTQEADFEDRLQEVKQLADGIAARPAPKLTVADMRAGLAECQIPDLVIEDGFNVTFAGNGDSASIPIVDLMSPEVGVADLAVRKIGCGFCVPPNPLLATLRFRIASNLEKIRTCRNFAGMRRSLQPYAPAADPLKAVQLAAAGEDVEAAVPTEPPPVHRFSYLIERARYNVDVARQLEAQLLNAFQQEDVDEYSLAKARHDQRLAGATVTLHDLRVQEATDGVTLAQLQVNKAAFQRSHFADLLATGELPYEIEAVQRLWTAHDFAIAAAVTGGIGTLIGQVAGAVGSGGGIIGLDIAGGALGAVGTVHSLASQARSMQASYQRRAQEWGFQRQLADQDVQIGSQHVTLARGSLAITGQEREIARLQGEFAGQVVEFLGTKFTGRELWVWMGRELRRYYRDHLNFATVIGRMAQRSLEFYLQQSLSIVASFYGDREHRDLLTAEQLLTDINKLDQHRLTTEQRRKELTKTISLAQLDPVAFNVLRQQGWMTFTTLQAMFDRDFPGHYLRLIKNVSLTVVALVPPAESIRATLANTGVSRVMVGPPFDQPRVIQRQPESIAVTVANNGTGLFEVRLDDPILLPFEGSGVETTWTLELPKGANRFDFETLADVLLSIRYTALEDPAYREKVLEQMGMTADRKVRTDGTVSFPVRTMFADEWYDLHNPRFMPDLNDYGFGAGKVKPTYLMQFEIRPVDLPPNETDHALTRLNIAVRQDRLLQVPLELTFRPQGGVVMYGVDADYDWDPGDANSGPISLAEFSRRRSGPNAAWQQVVTPLGQLTPFGTWWLRLRNEDAGAELVSSQQYNQNALDLSWLQDLLFVMVYRANVEYRFAT